MEGVAERPEGAGPAAWIAHHWWWALGALLSTEVATLLVRLTLLGSALDVTMGWLNFTALMIYVFGYPAASRHFSRLCVECVEAVPADGAARAERKQWSLYVFHLLYGNPLKTAVLFLVAMLVPIGLVLVGALESGSAPVMVARSALFLSYVVGTGVLAMVHRPLVPWCPYCRWGRGGDGPVETVPEPTPPSRSPERVT